VVVIELQGQPFAREREPDSRKAPSRCGKMVWHLLSALWEGLAWNVTLSATEPRLSGMTIGLGYALLRLVVGAFSTSTVF
jgi:hypothetical protein